MCKVLKRKKKTSSASTELQIKLFKGFLLIVQGSILVNLIPTLWDKTFPMGHCSVTFAVCSVLTLQIVGCPISLGEGTFVWSQVGAEPSRAQCDYGHWEDSNSAWLIIPSAITSSSCCPAQPWGRQCLGERRNICLTKGSEKPSSFLGVVSWEERGRKKNQK